MKKLVLGLAIVALVAAAGFAGTRAFFSDTETSQGNVFAAGSMDLQVGIDDRGELGDVLEPQSLPGNSALFAFRDLMPGDSGTGHFKLESSQDAWACMAGEVTDRDENSHLQQEQDVDDTSSSAGELQDYMELAFWIDSNPDGIVGSAEEHTLSAMPLEAFANGNYFPVQDSVESGNPLQAGEEYTQGFAYCLGTFETDGDGNVVVENNAPVCIGSSVGNDAQTDSLAGMISFYAEQSANNDEFVCGDLNEPNETQTHSLTDGGAPAVITVEDLGSSIMWTIDIDEATANDGNGHYAYGLVISQDGVVPAYQIHSNDGTDSGHAFGTHLYSVWGPSITDGFNGWQTSTANTEVSTLSWVDATGERDITSNPDGHFTVEIDKSELNSTFYWGVMTAADVTSSYPSTWATWSGDASGLEQYDL